MTAFHRALISSIQHLAETFRWSFIVALTAAALAASSAGADDTPGSLISFEPMQGAPDGASAYRVIYRSRGLSGASIPVSGVIIAPAGAAPSGGRPVVAWAHPTTGVVPRCAPSLSFKFFESVQGLNALLQRGYVVAATDYPGLGTPEVHPYLVGVSEGRAVIDSVRAAQNLLGPDASNTFAVWGHSQGGHAALFAGLLAHDYAPELNLSGIAVAAPATDLRVLMNDDLGSAAGNNITAMTLWSWSRIYHAPLTPVVLPQAVPVIDQLADDCIEGWFDVLTRRGPTQALEKAFLSVDDIADLEPWNRLLKENSPGPLPPGIPVFVVQGMSDKLVRPSVTTAYVNGLCQRGSKVRYEGLPDVGHLFSARDAAGDAVAWISARFRGEPPPNDCQ
ncbi:alpha/beta fold hydrolase [Aquabacter sp. CN5-332]|uniref:alpha/beta fold hydrolase n=1 Tax=Aquabacter sp. CN5-332 TaxID=3156608 RepID=UPI0032B3B133